MLTFGSLFAGIGGFDLGFERAGMQSVWQVEIDKSCRQLLAKHFPNAQRLDDVRTVGRHNLSPVDVICGGFPCQDLSVAGLRAGLKGERSGLFFEMTRIVDELRPALLIWENVPGLLSSNSGKDFLIVLMELERIGYSGCWTTLDARWFGVAQRRRRVFGVFARGDIGAATCAEILALRARMSRDIEPRKETGDSDSAVSGTLAASGGGTNRPAGNANELDFCIPIVAKPLLAKKGKRDNVGDENFIAVAIRNSNTSSNGNGFLYDGSTHTLGGSSDVIAFNNRQDPITSDIALPLGAKDNGNAIVTNTLRAGAGAIKHMADTTKVVSSQLGVRRLTPTECERLQGFPDGWTEGFADSTRYKMLGNAVAVPCTEWIGKRITQQLPLALGD